MDKYIDFAKIKKSYELYDRSELVPVDIAVLTNVFDFLNIKFYIFKLLL